MPIFQKDGKSFLFIHIPKTGGTTIEKAFETAGFTVSYRTDAGNPLNKVSKCTPQHLHGKLIRSLFKLNSFDGIFATVRDPIDRFRSEYAMRHKSSESTKEIQVTEWLEKKLSAYKKNEFLNDNHIRPQCEFVVPSCKIFRLENGLSEVGKWLKDAHEVDLGDKLERKKMVSDNISGYSSSSVEVSKKSEIILRDFYAQDFIDFDYK